MAEKSKTILLQTIEYIPLLIAIIITIGFLKLAIYYSVFNLSVFSYVEANDFVSEGLSNLGELSLALLIGYGFPLKLTPIKVEVEDGIKNYDSIKQNAKRFLKMTRLYGYMLIFIIVIASLYHFFKYSSFDIKSQRMLASALLGVFLLFYGLHIADSYLERTIYGNFNRNVFGIGVATLLYGTLIVWFRYWEAMDVKYDNSLRGTTVEIGNKKLVSDKKYYYIGETKSYIFFHNEIKNTNDVFLKSQIARIERVN